MRFQFHLSEEILYINPFYLLWSHVHCTCVEIIGVIKEVFIESHLNLFLQVNAKMLNNIIEEEDDCFVFFYEEVDPEAHAILAELEGE